MPTPTEILASLTPERLRSVVDGAPRKAREELFRSAGIRAKSSTFSLKGGDKSARIERLKDRLASGEGASPDAAEEVIRAYLGQRAALLSDALDHLEVPHRQGMTDADLDFMEQLAPNRVEALWSFLEAQGHDPADIDLYMQYMGVPQRGERG